MTHDEARLLLSAVADGEAERTPGVDAHLAGCAACTTYARDVARLSDLTAALPYPKAPAGLPARVARATRRRRRRWALVPALAAATAAAVVALTLPGPGTALLPLPPAAAAEPLLRLRSLYVERAITSGPYVTKEKIWWRAPGRVRIERDRTDPGGSSRELVIEGPGFRYADGVLSAGLPPSITLPEPISPTVALIGRVVGPGPVVAGRATTTYQVAVDGETRTAHVADGLVLGGRESLVLVKAGASGATKTTQVVRVNPDLAPELFVPPADGRADGGFRQRALGDLAIAPDRGLDGFALVAAGAGPEGEAFLLANGSLPVLVREGGIVGTRTSETRTVLRGGKPYLVEVDLYAPPSVQVDTGRGVVTVSAPLPLDSLVTLATGLYGLE